jgi:CubicO group peptidase (beta-lactamase class C family)
MSTAPPHRRGVQPGFDPVRDAFDALLAERPGWSGAFAAYIRGAPVVDLWGGPDWHEQSLVFLASVTKGLAATCIALLVDDGAIDLDAPVATYWPEFAAAGKQSVTVRVLLSHQAGLISVAGGATLAEVLEHEPLARKLAAQRPAWEPGARCSYHGVTIGPLMDELVRRVAGVPLRVFFQERIAAPLGASDDVYIGLPESEDVRLVPAVERPSAPAGEPTTAAADMEKWMADHDLAPIPSDFPLDSMARLEDVEALRRVGFPSAAGVANARGLARVYAACVSEVDGLQLLDGGTVREVSATQVRAEDAIAHTDVAFAIGYQAPYPGHEMAGPGSFGHAGYGGSSGFAHPGYGLGVGFTTNHVPAIPGGDPAVAELAAVLVRCAAEA